MPSAPLPPPPAPGLPLEAAPGAHLAAIATLAHVDDASNLGADEIADGVLPRRPKRQRSGGDKRLQAACVGGAERLRREPLDWRCGQFQSLIHPPFQLWWRAPVVRSGRVSIPPLRRPPAI